MASTSSAHITCLCGKVQAPGSLLLAEKLPIESEFCHCTDCRYVTGALYLAFTVLKSKPDDSVLSNLATYATSETYNRYFCKTCGCHCFNETRATDEWAVSPRMIEQTPEAKKRGEDWPETVVKLTKHIYLRNTIDGGLSKRLREVGGRPIPFYAQNDSDGKPMSEEEVSQLLQSKSIASPGKDDILQAMCHCGEVKLNLKRADWPEDYHGRYAPKDRSKYPAGFCVCRSCCLITGFSLMPWMYIPPQNVSDANGKILDFSSTSSNFSQLTDYESTKGTLRSFCSTCGATVFYWRHNRAESVVDVSVGILRAKSGAMAEEWLDWVWSRASHKEEMVDKELLDALIDKA